MSHTSAHVVRSVLEGLVMELTRYLGFFRESGLTPKRLIMCGGAADSHVTPQMVADVTGLDVLCQSRSGASAVGAAIIARSLTEADADLGALAGDMSPPARVVHPGPESERYHLLLAEYIGSLAS